MKEEVGLKELRLWPQNFVDRVKVFLGEKWKDLEIPEDSEN